MSGRRKSSAIHEVGFGVLGVTESFVHRRRESQQRGVIYPFQERIDHIRRAPRRCRARKKKVDNFKACQADSVDI